MQPSVICHRFSHRPISGGRWQPRVAGGGIYLFLPCPLVNLSTCQLVLPSGQLANRSTNQLVASSILPSIQSSTQSSIQSSVIDSAIHPSPLCRDAVPTLPNAKKVSTRCCPLPKAGTPPILDTPNSILSGIPTPAPTPTPTPKRKTSAPARPTAPCPGQRSRSGSR